MTDKVYVFILVGLVGVVIGAMLVGLPLSQEKIELGQAICEEEYGMDFVGYSTDSGLKCKPATAAQEPERYDGIAVTVEGLQ